jgi:hypothetical protein
MSYKFYRKMYDQILTIEMTKQSGPGCPHFNQGHSLTVGHVQTDLAIRGAGLIIPAIPNDENLSRVSTARVKLNQAKRV